MNILILEDTNTFVEEFVDILKNNNLFTDAHFFCLEDHFEEIDNTKDYQVIFIDVHLSKSINGIDFNKIYTEKMQYEKQLQKEKYIKQSLRLIQNISYDIDDKKHRIHWILEHIKHLNNDTNPKISKAIEQYQSKNTYQKLVASKNPVFDILISVKINRLQDDNISIKPFFEISQNEKYDDLDFIDVISEILDYVKRHSEITMSFNII